ncbi:uncharacterized [Tachysurus ichikawai]
MPETKQADAKQSRIRPDQSARHLLTILQTDSRLRGNLAIGTLITVTSSLVLWSWSWPVCPDGFFSSRSKVIWIVNFKKAGRSRLGNSVGSQSGHMSKQRLQDLSRSPPPTNLGDATEHRFCFDEDLSVCSVLKLETGDVQ